MATAIMKQKEVPEMDDVEEIIYSSLPVFFSVSFFSYIISQIQIKI